MTTDEARPARSGYRWPAEWEEHVATWLTWPHARTTWPGEGRLERVERAYVAMVEALSGRERVRIVVDGAAREDSINSATGRLAQEPLGLRDGNCLPSE